MEEKIINGSPFLDLRLFLTFDFSYIIRLIINYIKIFCIHERRGGVGSCEGFPSHFLFGQGDKVEQSSAPTKQFLPFDLQIQSPYIPNTKAKL